MRAYLDADVICEPALLGQIRAALGGAAPAYATGRLAVARAESWVTRAYADLWTRLPFVTGGAVGAGFFAVNAAGRARWGGFPEIISDDTFVRLNFAPDERHEVAARYHWPMVEGWRNLVRVRRRQDAGVAEVYRLGRSSGRTRARRRLGPAACSGCWRCGAARLSRLCPGRPGGAPAPARPRTGAGAGDGPRCWTGDGRAQFWHLYSLFPIPANQRRKPRL